MNRWRSALFVSLCSAVLSYGQVTGRISGSVLDPSGAAVPNAKVELFLPNGKTAARSTGTNGEGIFAFAAVRPEVYTLPIETSGFMKYTLGDLKVDPSKN